MTLVLVASVLVSCGGDSTGPTINQVTAESTAPLTDRTVGETVSDALRLRVLGKLDQGLPNIDVVFSVAGLDGERIAGKTSDTVRTGSDGVAVSGPWTLGRRPGTYTLSARALAGGSTLSRQASVTRVGALRTLTLSGPDAAAFNASLAVSAQAQDEFGNDVAGANVDVLLFDGLMRADSVRAVTDAGGRAQATLRFAVLGTSATVRAKSGAVQTASDKIVTVTSGPPAALEQAAGDAQTAAAGTAVPVRPAVRVRDAQGRPVTGSLVRFAVTAGAGTAGDSALSDATGVATVSGWVLGRTAGTNALRATMAGISGTVTFSATGVPGPAAKLAVNSPSTQSAVASAAVGSPPSVRVTDAYDNAVTAATPVTFTVRSGGGSALPASPATVNTTNGIATLTRWTLGPAQGVNTLVAQSAGLTPDSVRFTATVTQLPDTVRFIAGSGQSAPAGTPVPVLPKVKVVDAAGNPVEGVWVRFTATGPGTGATVAPDSLQTNAQGEATVTGWSLGRTVGTNLLAASVKKDATTTRTATLTATGVPGTAVKLVRNSTDPQSAAASSAVGSPPSVKVTDAYDNLVTSATPVVFTVTAGGGTLSPVSPATVSTTSGVATLTSWTLGPAQGLNILVASSGTLQGSPMTFTATATQLPDTVRFIAGAGQSAPAGTPVAVLPKVKVVDAAGNPVAGWWVRFTATGPGTGAVVAPDSLQTNAQGEATVTGWSLGRTVGTNTLSASVRKDPTTTRTTTLTATGVPGPAARLVRNSTDPQSAATSTAVASPPSVRVTDAYDNAVGAGTAVVFTVTAGGGTLSPASPATVSTNASGIATLTSWTLGPAAGTNTVVAASAGLQGSPLTFTATGSSSTPTVVVASITQGGSPVNLSNVSGRVDVGIAISSPSAPLDSVGVDIGGVRLATQQLGGAPFSGTVTLSVGTDTYTVMADSTAVPLLLNGARSLRAVIYPKLTAPIASGSIALLLQNADTFNARWTLPFLSAVSGSGQLWYKGSLAINMVPVMYSGATVSSVTVSECGQSVLDSSAPFAFVFSCAGFAASGVVPSVTSSTLSGGSPGPTAIGNLIFFQPGINLDNKPPAVSLTLPSSRWLGSAFSFLSGGQCLRVARYRRS
ncbi:MAG: Ig-like domain-containing protein [Gemmatimonadetes bacterium]|nr:Ig-like domain-containing protein [Gemmatimonadota bacterium]